jgi:hypothetical protein
MVARDVTELTYHYERWRAVAAGVLETAAHTFLLVIAVRSFAAGAIAKALVAGGGSMGLLVSPVVVSMVEKFGWPIARAAARLAAAGATAFLVMALAPVLPVFVLGSVLAMASSSAAIPLITQIYQENYPARDRGRRFSRTFMIRIGVAALFSDLAGRALSGDNIKYFQVLLLVFAAAFAFASYCFSRCPSRPLHVSGGTHPFRALHFARTDRLFRQTLLAWMLMGFASLMMFPMRVEYLANPKYRLALPVTMIAFLTGVVPNMARLIMSPVWGWLFDHANFFGLRMTLNLGFALGILTFFTSDSLSGLIVGAVTYGISNAGGDVAWSLWVTKFAPPDRVADYMSVHTFFTGVRGVIAPVVAFQAVTILSMKTLGWISIAMILGATLLLVPEMKFGRRARPAAPTVAEDMPE